MAAKERVEALSLPVAAIDAFITDESLAKTPKLCFGLLWGRQWLQQQGQQQQRYRHESSMCRDPAGK
jgi:hypothetical protein